MLTRDPSDESLARIVAGCLCAFAELGWAFELRFVCARDVMGTRENKPMPTRQKSIMHGFSSNTSERFMFFIIGANEVKKLL
jgi:hypothetical protein